MGMMSFWQFLHDIFGNKPNSLEMEKEEKVTRILRTSEAGLQIIREHEGLRLKAYKDVGGIPTIGYGHIKNVKMGDTCTKEQAEAWLIDDICEAENCIRQNVGMPLNQNQFDALVSFIYNIGVNAFKRSTLLKRLNQMETDLAADEFLRWNKVGKKVVNGLTARREKERALFLS